MNSPNQQPVDGNAPGTPSFVHNDSPEAFGTGSSGRNPAGEQSRATTPNAHALDPKGVLFHFQSMPNRLSEMVDASEILIAYCCRNAVKPKDLEDANLKKLLEELIKGREAFRTGKMDAVLEAAFLEDFRRLSRAIAPVTVRSIQDSVWDEGRFRPPFFLPRLPRLPISRASAAITRFTIVSVAALLLLLSFQIMWLIGFSLIKQIKDLSKVVVVAEKAIASTIEVSPNPRTPSATGAEKSIGTIATPAPAVTSEAPRADHSAPQSSGRDSAGTVTPPPKSDGEPELESAEAAASKPPVRRSFPSTGTDESDYITDQNRFLQRGAAFDLLKQWWNVWPGTVIPDKMPDPIPFNNSVLISSNSILNILEVYVLPLLYGLMGACTYVLRQLVVEMRDRTYRSESEISYWVRIFLGLLAGLAIGWFLRPDTQLGVDPTKDTGHLLSRLPPFALSYVAGYSVELLFSAMDRIVTAFGATSQNSKS